MSLQKEIKDRWFFYQASGEELFKKFEQWWQNFYCWFDPTADSLHLGNFIGFMLAVHLMLEWNKYFALVWWATGMIWDPWWKESERSFLDEKTLKYNEDSIKKQVSSILKHLEEVTWKKLDFEVINNLDFYRDFSYLEFLRVVWKYITINQMMSKDTVKRRIDDPTKSISYTEFSYMLLQWYDFYKLFTDKNVSLQIWWQDQWWNLVTWIELIRKKSDREAFCLTFPLITDSSGKKFGKSEWNAIWLDRNKTSPYKLYQYFLNSTDEDLEKYLKILTLLPLEQINKILVQHNENKELRLGQKVLAREVVSIIHSNNDTNISEKISEVMFWNSSKMDILNWLTQDEFDSFIIEIWWVMYENENLFEIIVKSLLATSNSDARKTIECWALYINEEKITDTKYDFSSDFTKKWFILLRKWKKNFKLIYKK